ncbi:hypothetical protein LINPERHAP1_LOCUS23145 [Linum perenne]
MCCIIFCLLMTQSSLEQLLFQKQCIFNCC